MYGLRVLIVNKDATSSKEMADSLSQLGCNIIGKVAENAVALRAISISQPDLVVVSDPSYFKETVGVVLEDLIAPLIIMTDKQGSRKDLPMLYDRVPCELVLRPYTRQNLSLAIKIQLDRFQQALDIKQSRQVLHATETTRAIVDKATDILQQQSGKDKVHLVYHLQVKALEKGITLRQVAEELLASGY